MDRTYMGSCTIDTVTGGTLPNFIQNMRCISRNDPIAVSGLRKCLFTQPVHTRLSHVLHLITPSGDLQILQYRWVCT